MTIGCVGTDHLYFTNGAYAAEMSSEQHKLHLTLWIYSQVRVNFLSYNLIYFILWYVRIIYKFYELVSLWFGCIMCLMIVSCALGNFMWWELRFSWVWELGCDWGISLYIRKSLSVISFGFSSRWREREHGHLSSSCTISRVFCFQVRDLWQVLLISIKII